MMTDTKVTRKVIGAAAPQHYNRPIAEAMQSNIEKVGLPTWSDEEQIFAKAVQRLTAGKEDGLSLTLKKFDAPLGQSEQ
jgi:aminobenzoyl-glutamate utilization protein B